MTKVHCYAKAFYELTQQDELLLESSLILVEHYRLGGLQKVFSNPRISVTDKCKVIKTIGEKLALPPQLMQFAQLLIMKQCEKEFVAIFQAYQKRLYAKLGWVRADVFSAKPLLEEELKKITAYYSERMQRKVVVRNLIRSSLIHGVKVVIEGICLDNTMKFHLDHLKASCLQQVIVS